jgi:hypothetical protein
MTPYGFAFWRAADWQFPYQQTIDHATFGRPELIVLEGDPTMLNTPDEAQYEYRLRFGPRS